MISSTAGQRCFDKIYLTKKFRLIFIIFYDFSNLINRIFFHPCLVLSGGIYGFICFRMGAETTEEKKKYYG